MRSKKVLHFNVVLVHLKGNFVCFMFGEVNFWLLFFILATVYLFNSETLKLKRHINTYLSHSSVPELKRDISSDKIFTTLTM